MALTQPIDVELDTILRWCARAREVPPTPADEGLDEATLTEVPRWLHHAYPELFSREQLRERLNFYDMCGELTLYAHHPQADGRGAAKERITRLLSGHNHLDGLICRDSRFYAATTRRLVAELIDKLRDLSPLQLSH